MKASRLYNGMISEIDVDVDGVTGEPILPPDTTVDPRPPEVEGQYLTIEGNQWKYIEIVQPSLFQLKQNKMIQFEEFRQAYMDRPVTVAGADFDADDTARTRLTQALVMYRDFNYLPPVWIRHDNGAHPLASIDDLKAIAQAVMTAFSTRFYEIVAIRDAISNAATKEELEAVVIPAIV